jgi:hypothetical protein
LIYEVNGQIKPEASLYIGEGLAGHRASLNGSDKLPAAVTQSSGWGAVLLDFGRC